LEYTPFGQLFARHVCTILRSLVSFRFLPSRSCPTLNAPPTRRLTVVGCNDSLVCFFESMIVS